jgi:hypothetical protein
MVFPRISPSKISHETKAPRSITNLFNPPKTTSGNLPALNLAFLRFTLFKKRQDGLGRAPENGHAIPSSRKFRTTRICPGAGSVADVS